MLLTKVVLKYIFVKLQDLEKETELSFLIGLSNNIGTYLYGGKITLLIVYKTYFSGGGLT